jgi:predicted nuclease of restriction endonuclease-like (RecB) superfamily
MQTMVSSQTLPRPTLPDGYPQLLARLKREIGAARTRAALAVNDELIGLYWRIGNEILERQEREGWGAKIIDRLATDLRQEFHAMKGLSARNLKYMRQFAAAWPERAIVPQPVAQLPWGHVRCLLDKLDDPAARLWYAQHAVEHAWSRKLLEHHIAERHDATIGLVLCASRNETVARYALNGIDRPVGVARYTPTPTVAEQVPEELLDQLPELAEISAGVQLIVERHADEVAEAEAGHGGV